MTLDGEAGNLAVADPHQRVILTRDRRSQCVTLFFAALRDSFFPVSLSFGFGSIKLIVKGVQ
jgi:hypothetical protein